MAKIIRHHPTSDVLTHWLDSAAPTECPVVLKVMLAMNQCLDGLWSKALAIIYMPCAACVCVCVYVWCMYVCFDSDRHVRKIVLTIHGSGETHNYGKK